MSSLLGWPLVLRSTAGIIITIINNHRMKFRILSLLLLLLLLSTLTKVYRILHLQARTFFREGPCNPRPMVAVFGVGLQCKNPCNLLLGDGIVAYFWIQVVEPTVSAL